MLQFFNEAPGGKNADLEYTKDLSNNSTYLQIRVRKNRTRGHINSFYK